MLPRFLLADNSQENPETIYVVLDDFEQNRVIHWIDPEPESENIIEGLLEEAADFLEDELNNQEHLYDEEFDLN